MILEIPFQSPIEIFTLFADQPDAVFFDSAQIREGCGRYSYIALEPFQKIMAKKNEIILGEQRLQGDPWEMLAAEIDKFSLDTVPGLPPFQGGVAGFFGYELAQHLENVPRARFDDMDFPDLVLGFYDLVIAFDHAEQRAWIVSSGYPLQGKARDARAQSRLLYLQNKLLNQATFPCSPARNVECQVQANFSQAEYCHAVQRVIDYILAGDIFEANISQRFVASLPTDVTPFVLYQQLRSINPAPFAAYLNFGDVVLASASPERFLKLSDRIVETRPIKGTRPRSNNLDEDRALAQELLQSEKDHAENVMIVDLMRNDLSRVCEDFSVQVPQLCGLESYASVHHLVSVVLGKLRAGVTAIDLLRATFPGGSITGAPKIRAMEIIAEIEPTVRGPYCGSIGYIGFDGAMDTSITIRTYAIKNNRVTFQAGGAVVVDSDPQAEYEETLTKSRALRDALNGQ